MASPSDASRHAGALVESITTAALKDFFAPPPPPPPNNDDDASGNEEGGDAKVSRDAGAGSAAALPTPPAASKSAKRTNQYAECVLNAYLASAAHSSPVYSELATRHYGRHGRGCVYLQNFSLEAALGASSAIVVGLSRSEYAAVPGSDAALQLIDNYDPRTQFVFVASVVVDERNRGWWASAVVARQQCGDAARDARLFKYPTRASDPTLATYDPTYAHEYAAAKDAGGADDDDHRDALSAYRRGGDAESAHLQWLREQKLANHDEPHQWPLIACEQFELEHIVQSNNNDDGGGGGLLPPSFYDALREKVRRQTLLRGCMAHPCAVTESEAGQFDKFACKRCGCVAYCSARCAKTDAHTAAECRRGAEFASEWRREATVRFLHELPSAAARTARRQPLSSRRRVTNGVEF